ncbi:hypothetical protein A3A95_04215 [Candidatus Nomurabacteria bacterium RIFCSPLOWO2_01_FULL_39_18]|uniref:Aminoglycoside nucleotidyltransferase n=1 Tax=Candidatus Nomurabacteria bacterium RIFCSPHIGHO2_01_FULL_40_24b TaxID=1801739 RepID=A0A1F6V685_9BACT|nr:MAG: hypothetical protein A2647_04305 [Candidatus Nomurabacteria bacterium RIFCSPHIGHO2_01_FULL_40_24b]OGI89303.1 MAG: hypothetical protein A3A95_04215 [Candidatus Nomurabacteria bacterium RIFCSPLOWO2_01_FULL_39_18]
MSRINPEDVVDFYKSLENLGIKIWIDGGFSVDALLGEQTRKHLDLDIAINQEDMVSLVRFLATEGYKEIRRDNEYNLVFGDKIGREIDIHAFISDKEGNIVGGIMYPTQSLTGLGTINGHLVRCISPEHMVKFLAQWVHKHPHKYLYVISSLCQKFSIEYPKEYIDVKKLY